MERTECITVLRRLRDGMDPSTGERLPPDHECQRADVVRALFVAVQCVEAAPIDDLEEASAPGADDAGAAPRSRRPRAPNSGQPWSEEDDRRLVEAFDGGADERELGAAFGRSRSSIRARLIRLGRGALLGEGPAPRYPVVAPESEVTEEPVGA